MTVNSTAILQRMLAEKDRYVCGIEGPHLRNLCSAASWHAAAASYCLHTAWKVFLPLHMRVASCAASLVPAATQPYQRLRPAMRRHPRPPPAQS